MPTLDWIGKKAVVNHHREVPYRLLHCDKALSAGDGQRADAGNLLVQGDNLAALKALLPYYAGKVKCITIDPPYNTGNENWVYNDNVNSPEIRQWLGRVVGKEAEDLSRHDKWLCLMYPRFALLKDFLSEDGAIFISIDDVEIGRLRLEMNEIFRPAQPNCEFRVAIKGHSGPAITAPFWRRPEGLRQDFSGFILRWGLLRRTLHPSRPPRLGTLAQE
jgi:adenine-specific DNA-methyltransferase